MSLVLRAPDRATDLAIAKLKSDGIVHPDAVFNPDAPGNLRREVAYYDRDFMGRLGRTPAEADVVDAALGMLKEHGLVGGASVYGAMAFEQHRSEVKNSFSGAWTSLRCTIDLFLGLG